MFRAYPNLTRTAYIVSQSDEITAPPHAPPSQQHHGHFYTLNSASCAVAWYEKFQVSVYRFILLSGGFLSGSDILYC